MPSRILREGILDSLLVNSLSEPAEILYRRLMSIVDDYGRFEAHPAILRARCFPLQLDRWPVERVEKYLTELSEQNLFHGVQPLVTVYTANGKKFLQINNFGQRVQSKPKFPEPQSSDSTEIHRESPSRASRARTKTESETYSESESETNAKSGAKPESSARELQRKSAPAHPPSVRSKPLPEGKIQGPLSDDNGEIRIPDKRMDRDAAKRPPANDVINPQRIELMRAILHGYMQRAGTLEQREWKPPDDAIVTQCLTAVGTAPMKDVAAYLHRLYAGLDAQGLQTLKPQPPGVDGGPKGYGWFPTMLALEFKPERETAGATA